MKLKTINIKPDDVFVSSILSDGTFLISATDIKKQIRMIMPRWFLAYIAEQFHKTINAEQAEIDRMKQAMRGEKS